MKFNSIFWDFDGVIVDSDDVRVLGFKKVLKSYPSESVNQLLKFHSVNGGLSRYVKFRHFFEQILGTPIEEEKINVLAARFSSIMREMLTSKEVLIQETVDFIQRMYDKGVQQFIVSGSDEKELRFLCHELEISDLFVEIKGSPTPKTELVADLIEAYSLDISKSILIGDSINDFEAAQANNLNFIGYNNPDLIKFGKYVNSFSDWN